MATIPTSIGPIGARQINNTLYVGQSDLTTIQSAVNYAVAQGDSFVIIIPHGYSSADSIAAIVNGSANIILSDLRGYNAQNYEWVAPNYVPADFTQTGNVFAATLGVSGVATIVGELHAYGGISTELILVGQTPAVTGAKVLLIGTNPSTNQIQLTGQTIGGAYDQDILINPTGANVLIGSGVTIDHPGTITAATGHINGVLTVIGNQTVGGTSTVGGDITTQGTVHAASASITGTLTASDAQFATCEVANSPVRTFANTGDAPAGMVWPPIGVAISAGSAWGTSIDPATLATWPAAGVPVSTGTAWGASLPTSSLATYPPAGVAVSTGTAWGTPLAVANVALLNAANTFGVVQTFNQPPQFGQGLGPIFGFPPTAGFGGNGLYFGWSHGTPGMADFVNQPGTGSTGFNWWTVTSAGATTLMGTLTLSGGLVLPSAIRGTGLTVNGAAPSVASSVRISESAGSGFIDFLGSTPTSQGAGWIRTQSSDSSAGTNIVQFLATTVTFQVNTQVSGNFYASGTISSGGAKGFKIRHPLDDTKDLFHACLEGPEAGVFYRGEGVTTGGWAEITLPDYFEALTMPEDRTVLLTALFEDEAEQVGMVAASRVKDGKFKVWSALPAQKFYWEVKATRADIEPLEVETPHTPRAGSSEGGSSK